MPQENEYITQLEEQIVSLKQRIRTIAVSQAPQPIDALAFFAAHAPQPPANWEPDSFTGGISTDQAYCKSEYDSRISVAWRWHYAQLMLDSRPASPHPNK